MRAVVADSGRASAVEIAEPDPPGPDQTVVDVVGAGICGSDLHLLSLGFSGPVLGHEFGGYLADGTLVAVRPTGECGACRSCIGGRPHLCRDALGTLHGTAIPGGMSERVLVESSRVVPVPASLRPGDVALIEPLAVAIHGVRRARVSLEDRVAVIGAGSIGLLTVAALTGLGIKPHLMARHAHQRRAGEALGAVDASESLPGGADHGAVPDNGSDFDAVFDAVSTQPSLDAALTLVRPGGTLVEFGMFWSPVTVGNNLLFKEVTLVPSMFYSHDHDHDDFAEAAQLLAGRPEIGDTLVTHRFALDDAERAFAVAADRASGAIKVHLVP